MSEVKDQGQLRGWERGSAMGRVVMAFVVGVAAAVITGLAYRWAYAPIVGWAVAALAFEIGAWATMYAMTADDTRQHATRNDPSRGTRDVLLLLANLASLAAVGIVVVDGGHRHGVARGLIGLLALLSVAVSWVLVQTVYTLRYAKMYYGDRPGGIEFDGGTPPDYHDFAYLSFTMGMTYQVSDTNLASREFRRTVLRHALLSYVFGSVILATTVNLVVGLSSG